MNPREFMQGFPRLFALSLLLVALPCGAEATDASVVSVLTMAKDEAEKAENEAYRIELRVKVAGFMRRTGHELTFGAYAADAFAALERHTATRSVDEIDKHNLKIEREANHALLAGDAASAKRLMAECKIKWPPPSCSTGELMIPYDVFLDMKFLRWEIDAGKMDAALSRLRDAAWPPDMWQLMLLLVGADIAAGDPARSEEIARIIRRSGIVITSCVADRSSMFLYSEAKTRPFSHKAKLRKMACAGEADTAIAEAQAQRDVGGRVISLGVVAEGLAGIPGLPDD